MRTIQCVRAGVLVGAVAACALIGGAARAATTHTRPGSLLMFPKVVTTGTRDTVVQITNTGNMPIDLRCFYLNGSTCIPTDFHVALTKQQPTFWSAGAGRRVDPTDGTRGLDPGLIPPLPPNFAGALVCAEVDSGDVPVIRNQVKGEATIVDNSGTSTTNSVSKYNAIAVQGIQPNGNNSLELDDVEYSGCPASLVLNFEAQGEDSVVEALGNGGRCSGNFQGCNSTTDCVGTCIDSFCSNNSAVGCTTDPNCDFGTCSSGESRVLTRVTLLPCNLDFETLKPTEVALSFNGFDEEESILSGGGRFTCWTSFTVPQSDFSLTPPGTAFATVGIKSTEGGPVVGIAEVFHSDSVANTGSAAVNLHTQGLCVDGDRDGRACTRDFECTGGGTCKVTASAVVQLSTP